MILVVLTYCWVAAGILTGTNCQKVEVFDGTNFTAPIITVEGATGCSNLTTGRGFLNEARSLKTATCIGLYKELDCQGRYIVVYPGQYSDLSVIKHQTLDFVGAKSANLWAGSKCRHQVDYDIYGTAMIIGDDVPAYNGVLLEYRNVCECINLLTRDQYIGTVTGVWNFENYIMLYEERNCQGKSLQLLGGLSPESARIPDSYSFIIPSASISPCELPPSCYILTIEVYKFTLTSMENIEAVRNRSVNVTLGTQIILQNNGSAVASKSYEGSRVIEEVVEITRIPGFAHASNTFVKARQVNYDLQGHWFRNEEKVKNAVTKAYETSANAADNVGNYISKEDKTISVKELIELHPCSEYTVHSYVTVVKNLPAQYEFYATVTGKQNNPLTAIELKERLAEGLVYVQNIDNNTIMARGTGTILVDFSLDATVKGDGLQLQDCPLSTNDIKTFEFPKPANTIYPKK